MAIITKEWIDANDAIIQQKLQSLAYIKIVRTLPSEPQNWESLLTYSIDNKTYNFKIGDEVRIPDAKSETGYIYYKLYAIDNNEAQWNKLDTEGGSSLFATITVNLEAYSNNIKNSGADLVGVIVTLSDGTTSTTATLESGQTSVIFTNVVPMKNYTVSVAQVTGYTQPASQTITNIYYAAEETLTFQYYADEYTLTAISNQSNDNIIAAVEATISYGLVSATTIGTYKVSQGTEVTITFPDITGYKKTVSNVGKVYTASYETEIVTVTLTTEANVDISEATFTITDGSNNVLGTGESGDSVKVPYDVVYTISAEETNEVVALSVSYTASQVSRTAIVEYVQLYVDLGLPSGTLWAIGDLAKLNYQDDNYGIYQSGAIGQIPFFSYGNVDGYTQSGDDTYTFSESNYNNSDAYALYSLYPNQGSDINGNSIYDAARAKLGSSWRMPTREEAEELSPNTDKEQVKIGNHYFIKVMNKEDHDKYILFALRGYCENDTRNSTDRSCVWTSKGLSGGSAYVIDAYYNMYNSRTYVDAGSQKYTNRYYGLIIHPIFVPHYNITLTVTTADNTSNEGLSVTVTDSEGTAHAGTTDSSGVVVLRGLSAGNATVSITGYEVSTNTITINSTSRTLSITCAYSPLGVFIQTTDGDLITADDWSTLGANKTVNGIAILTSEHKFVIAPDDLGMMQLYNSNTYDGSQFTAINTETEARQRFDGYADTALYNSVYGTSYASGAASNYTFANGQKGYLPSAGEAYLTCLNMSQVEACVVAGNMDTLHFDTGSWTSTFKQRTSNTNYAWEINRQGGMDGYTVDNSFRVRPFTSYQISVTLHLGSNAAGAYVCLFGDTNMYATADSNGDVTVNVPTGVYTLSSYDYTFSETTIMAYSTISYNITSTRVEFVDLGLPSGLLWATGNLVKDASGNYAIGGGTDYGTYVSWANVVGHNEGEWYNFDQTTYNSTTGASQSTNISSNDAAHDIALATLGTPWHLPTKEDYQELVDNTDSEWTTINGVTGRKFMKKSDHSVYVFFPASGRLEGRSLLLRESYGYYWSASFNSSGGAGGMIFTSDGAYVQNSQSRILGFTVHPVKPSSV